MKTDVYLAMTDVVADMYVSSETDAKAQKALHEIFLICQNYLDKKGA